MTSILVQFVAVCLLMPVAAFADDGAEFFEAKVRPILVEHCLGCHGEQKQKGGLRLDSKAGWEKGGDTGPVVVPGKPEKSLLVRMVKGTIGSPPRMPPERVLPEQAVKDLVKWIEIGAPDPRVAKTAQVAREIDWQAAAEFWAFRPVEPDKQPHAPHSIDRLISAKLEAAELAPVGRADKRTLVRRLTFDLTGLPPTPEEVAAFLKDETSDAYSKLVDRLLASPHYGEHQARYWLDLARYAEDQAHSASITLPHAWRYRDWVVESFNQDLPYDRFVKLQLAADLMEQPTDDPSHRRALGFLGLGAAYYKNNDIPKVTAEEWDDRVDTLTRTFLGLTVSCARCHDHKFDPIPTQDYYSIAGVIASTRNTVLPVGSRELTAAYDAAMARAAEVEQAAKAFLQTETDRAAIAKSAVLAEYALKTWAYHAAKVDKPDLKADEFARAAKLDPAAFVAVDLYLRRENRGPKHDLVSWPSLLPKKDGPREPPTAVRELAEKFQSMVIANLAKPLKVRNLDQPKDLFGDKGAFPLPEKAVVAAASAEWQAEYVRLTAALKEAKAMIPAIPPQAHGVADLPKPADLKVYLRGSPYKLGEVAPRRFLRAVAGVKAAPFKNGSGRLELAEAIADPKNPLTARVMVNRIWQQHFGRGLVSTPSNFGYLGERPTHPELLDFLADWFVRVGWSVKKLHREIVLSDVYCRTSSANAKALEVDPENRLLARMPRRRLTIEGFRDAALSVSGSLDSALAGPSVELDDPKSVRRTLYGRVKRSELNPLLRVFDFPDPNISSERRTETTLPQQALFLINSPFMLKRAKDLAARLANESTSAERVRLGYSLAFGRPPTEDELKTAAAFLAAEDKQSSGQPIAPTRLERFAQALMASNEFLFVD